MAARSLLLAPTFRTSGYALLVVACGALLPAAASGQGGGYPAQITPIGPAVQSIPTAAPAREPIRVSLPVPQLNSAGELLVRPNVAGSTWTYAPAPTPAASGQTWGTQSIWNAQPTTGVQNVALQAETLPPPGPGLTWPGNDAAADTSEAAPGPLSGILGGDPSDLIWATEPLVPWDEFRGLAQRPRSPNGEPGIGRERVAYAPFEMDITQTFGNFLFRTDAGFNLTKPDRAEYFWGRPGRGPILPERSINYQDFHLRMENGNEVFSLATDVPIRLINPEVNGNNGGIGDIQLVQKTVLMNGGRWQMTQLLRTIFNSGNARKGLGTGHVSMEPGMLFRYKWSDITYIHSELEIRFPLGGDPIYSGPAVTYGFGISTVWYESDTFAVIPTFEYVNIWILDGQVIPPGGGAPVDVRGDGIFNLGPGTRLVWDTGGDLGVLEFGFNTMVGVGSNGWYDVLTRFDLRFVF